MLTDTNDLLDARPLDRPRPGASVRPLRALLFAWLAAGVALAASGAIARLPVPAIPLMIWSPVLVGVVAYRSSAALRDALARIDVRALIFPHVLRAAFGVAFLALAARGRMPDAFAQPAGWGDIAIGLSALFAAVPALARRRTLVLGWSLLGLADILLAFLAAQRLLFFAPKPDARMLETMSHFPLSTVPTVVVPLILMTHLLLIARARKEVAATGSGSFPSGGPTG
jgi:hypothetical protein